MLVNLNQHQAGAEDGEGMRPSTDAGGLRGDKLTSLPMTIAWVGGSAVQISVRPKFSGLNRVFHELGPPRGVAEYMH